MARNRPLNCKVVKTILSNLGFTPRPRKGTSHEQWVKDSNGRRYKVTVDCPKQPFGQDLIGSMARQAGGKQRRIL
jgi:predicted RNA binding protein YcfA (HicA-like mRNA interferase family)